jgi:hypothetical protein
MRLNLWRVFLVNKMNPLFKTLPVVVIALVLGSWAIWWGASSVFEGYVSSTWPQTMGTIQESRIASSWSSGGPHGGGGTSYHPVITYAYTVDGHAYSGSRINTRGAWNSGTSSEVVAAYPVGSQRPVYYSPSDPGNSILVTGVHRSSFFGLVLGTIILSFGALFGAMAYLASKYGTPGSRSYSFDDDSPAAPVAIFGMIAIFCQFGLLFWILR